MAKYFAVLGVIGMCSRGRLDKRRKPEAGVSHQYVHDMDALDRWNLPGQKVIRITPGDNLRTVNARGSLLQMELALAPPVRD